jgi:predicted N-acetyltransferase YhbS
MALNGPKAAKENELASVIELPERVFRSGWQTTMVQEFPLMFAPDNAENLRVFTDKGKAVSLVGMLVRDAWMLGTRHRCCCIGGVCTDPAYRGKGLATRLMDDARRKAVADGVDIFLISGGRGLYRRLDYVDAGTYFSCKVRLSRLPRKGAYSLRTWRPEDLTALVRIYSAEPVRFERTPEDFLAFVSTGLVGCSAGTTAVVCPSDCDEPVAYFTYQIGGPPWERKPKDSVTVIEMGGPRYAIFRALGALLDRQGVDAAEVRFLGSDTETAELARSFGWPTQPQGFRGTVGVVEPARFWQACLPLFAERLGRERAARLKMAGGEQVKISYGRERVVLHSMSAFTHLVFGPASRRDQLDLGLRPGSELAAVLDDIFPLPLVDYGLNFV